MTPVAYWKNAWARRSFLIVATIPLIAIVCLCGTVEALYDLAPEIGSALARAWRGQGRC